MVSLGIRHSEWGRKGTHAAFHLPQLDTLVTARNDTGTDVGKARHVVKR